MGESGENKRSCAVFQGIHDLENKRSGRKHTALRIVIANKKLKVKRGKHKKGSENQIKKK